MAQEQENFWANQYSKEYIDKNDTFNPDLSTEGWTQMLKKANEVTSLLECGSNIGRNIKTLDESLPKAKKSIIEISKPAFDIVTKEYELDKTFNGSILESNFENHSFDLVYTMGVLIHIHPDDLLNNMSKMYDYSCRYILMGEYFNRTPVMIEYHGEVNKLFKRDFGKLFLENFNASLVDYGFLWGHIYDEGGFDDITWWLFEKN